MKCSMNLTNVTPDQLPALMSTLSVLGISFNLHYHREQDDTIDDEFLTPPSSIKRLPVTPIKVNKPISNASMMCAHALCSKVGGFYNRECYPRVYYCAEHKPDESYKTHKTFTLENLRRQTDRIQKRFREAATDYDDNGWLQSRNLPRNDTVVTAAAQE